jgi:Protein of unknown function (DUF2934)
MLMAKRTTPRSTAQDSTAMNAPAQPRPRRPRAPQAPAPPAPPLDTLAANSRVEGRENGRSGASSATPGEAGDDAPLETMSVSMASEPSEEDIRNRAYHRFLERGGGHGSDFEDWLEAERELKGHR